MLLVILLVVLLALTGVGVLSLWIKRAAASTRRIDAPDSQLQMSFYGGVMSRHLITSGSLAVLEFFDWGVRVRGNPVARWIVPTWEARYDELAIVELVTLPHSRIAVWMRLRGEEDGIGFLKDRVQEVVAEFERREVAVNRAVAQVRKVTELYHLPR